MATPLFRALSVLLVALVVACASPVPTPTPERTDFPTLPTSTFYDGPTPTSAAATETPSFTNPPTGTTSPTAEPTPAETTSTPTLPPDGSMAQILGTELGNTVEAERVRLEVPGTSAVILFPDGSRWTGVFGLADVERDLPVQSDTTFAVGSVTKTFTTAAIFQLQDEGALSIDDPLANWLPDYPNASAITLRHLLGHTSGVFNYFEDPQYNRRVFVTDVGHRWTPDEILTAFAREPYGVPGEQFHYSNTGFVLLGLVVEQETGLALGDVFEERFLEPLQLDSTYFQYDVPPPQTGALGYLVNQNGARVVRDGTDYRPTESAATVAWAAGNIASTATDLADWSDALYGGRVVSEASLAEMESYVQYSRDVYGLGTRTNVFAGHRAFGHTGSLRGFYAAMWHIDDLDADIVVLSNRGRYDPNVIIEALAQVATPLLEARL